MCLCEMGVFFCHLLRSREYATPCDCLFTPPVLLFLSFAVMTVQVTFHIADY